MILVLSVFPKITASDYHFGILDLRLLITTLVYKGNNKITELRTILQRESQNS